MECVHTLTRALKILNNYIHNFYANDALLFDISDIYSMSLLETFVTVLVRDL